jgi:glycosyltransferase involved in cell wall biosynthesis
VHSADRARAARDQPPNEREAHADLTTKTSLGDLESMIDRVSWSQATQHEMLADFDLGIFPLPNEPYSYGKCSYKLLQYGAAGVPAVVTPIGVNEQILLELGMPGATSEVEWVDALLDAVADHSAADHEGERPGFDQK